MKIPGLQKGRERFDCKQNAETGEVSCRSFREFEDGTRVELAGEDFQINRESCETIPVSVFENESGALDRLDKKARTFLKTKCKGNRPTDY